MLNKPHYPRPFLPRKRGEREKTVQRFSCGQVCLLRRPRPAPAENLEDYEPTVGAVIVIGWLKLAKSVVLLSVMLPCPFAPKFERTMALAMR